MQSRAKTGAHLALLLTNLFFAINFTTVKYLINEGLIKPFGLNLVRVLIPVILFWMLAPMAKGVRKKIDRSDWARIFWCALTGIAINQLLFIKGLSLTSSIHASLLMLATPILITFIAAWLLKERLNIYKIIGLGLGITGATILIRLRDKAMPGENMLLGDVLVIINAISYTFYFILVKPLMEKYSPVVVIRMVFTFGLIMIIPFCWQEFREIPWHRYRWADWAVLSQIVVLGTFLAYLLNIFGIKEVGASVAGSYIYSQPLFAAVIAAFVLREEVSLYKIIAGIFIFAGVFLARKPSSATLEE